MGGVSADPGAAPLIVSVPPAAVDGDTYIREQETGTQLVVHDTHDLLHPRSLMYQKRGN